jgi:hypothetical protein
MQLGVDGLDVAHARSVRSVRLAISDPRRHVSGKGTNAPHNRCAIDTESLNLDTRESRSPDGHDVAHIPARLGEAVANFAAGRDEGIARCQE